MTFFPEPIKPSEGKKEEQLRVSPIEADKYGSEGGEGEGKESKKTLAIYTAFLVFIDKVTTLLSKEKGANLEEVSEDSLTTTIQELKGVLQILMDQDQSGNGTFCGQFSKLWIKLMENLQILTLTKRVVLIDPKKLKSLMSEIDNYPPNEEHKLGYYLSAFAGENWLPLPFQEIMKRLYADHRVNQKNSTLMQWVESINDILNA